MKTWNTIKLFYYLWKAARRPENTTAALAITECLYKLGLLQAETDRVKQSEDACEVINKKLPLEIKDLKELNRLPLGTLGREYSDFMIKENLNPAYYKVLNTKDDTTFIMMRLRETHDMWHTLTGFGTSLPDELGLLSFMMAQVHSPFSPIVIAAALIKAALKNPKEAVEIMDRVSKGWHMGVKAKLIFAVNWPMYWETSLTQVRAYYKIEPYRFSECG